MSTGRLVPRLPLACALLLAFACFLAPVTPLRAAEIQQVRSPGGITAWLVEEKSLPIIAIRFGFDGGSTQEAAGKEGTAGLLAAMLDQGAGDLGGPAYQKQIEKLSVRLAFDSDRDTFFGNFETLTKNLAKGTELLRLALTSPLIEPAILERTRAQLLARARRRDPLASLTVHDHVADLGANAGFEPVAKGAVLRDVRLALRDG